MTKADLAAKVLASANEKRPSVRTKFGNWKIECPGVPGTSRAICGVETVREVGPRDEAFENVARQSGFKKKGNRWYCRKCFPLLPQPKNTRKK